jgi:hypothetical protein
MPLATPWRPLVAIRQRPVRAFALTWARFFSPSASAIHGHEVVETLN